MIRYHRHRRPLSPEEREKAERQVLGVISIGLLAAKVAGTACGEAMRPVASPAEPASPPPRRRAAGILSARAAARQIGIGRDTLAWLAESGQIVTVPKGSRPGYRAVDVERIVERGYTLPATLRPAPQARRRRHSRRSATADDAAVATELAKF
jgi:hypothetical protein